ncbi:MAG: hypothetical protein JO218_14155 [Burkholderiales bacterium]|nr:hypothetical protein [Burkholderiales bacterium]
MVITQSQLALTGGYALSVTQDTQVSVSLASAASSTGDTVVSLSTHASTLLQLNATSAASTLAPEKQAIWMLIKALIKRLTGRDATLEVVAPTAPADVPPTEATSASVQSTTTTTTSLDVSASGEVTTADGQTINVNAQLSLYQQTTESNSLDAGSAATQQEQLVMNFSASSAS